MNMQSSAVPESFGRQEVTPAVMSATRPLYWSVRRELWEYRSIVLAPLLVSAIALFAFMISSFLGIWEVALRVNPQSSTAIEPYNFVALLLMGTTFIVSFFYSLDSLHGERRDRSILFWKSLPVSDAMTVLSKAAIPLVVLPLLTFAVTAITQLIMLLWGTIVVSIGGSSVASLWDHVPLFQTWVMLLYHLVAVHSLWYAPFYGWSFFVSAWARRAPFLWAVLPPLAIGFFERIAFHTSHFASMISHRFAGGHESAPFPANSMSIDHPLHLNVGQFLISPGLWIGLAITAAFLAAAVLLRRSRGPI
jgi:ABC-2 type transport system permease protein